MWTRPTVADFKAYFARDFKYAPSTDPSDLRYILDADITKAMDQAEANFNPDLGYGSDAQIKQAFLYEAAFYMVENLRLSSEGLSSQSNFPISAKSVAGVSVSYQVPEEFMKDSFISYLTSNGYGLMFLSLSIPFIRGRVRIAAGTTTFR